MIMLISLFILALKLTYFEVESLHSSVHSTSSLTLLLMIQLFMSSISPQFDLQRPCRKFHTISLHSSGCTSTGSQYVAIIGPVLEPQSQAINPFLLLFALWLTVTGCSIIRQEHTCPLHFTLISFSATL